MLIRQSCSGKGGEVDDCLVWSLFPSWILRCTFFHEGYLRWLDICGANTDITLPCLRAGVFWKRLSCIAKVLMLPSPIFWYDRQSVRLLQWNKRKDKNNRALYAPCDYEETSGGSFSHVHTLHDILSTIWCDDACRHKLHSWSNAFTDMNKNKSKLRRMQLHCASKHVSTTKVQEGRHRVKVQS